MALTPITNTVQNISSSSGPDLSTILIVAGAVLLLGVAIYVIIKRKK